MGPAIKPRAASHRLRTLEWRQGGGPAIEAEPTDRRAAGRQARRRAMSGRLMLPPEPCLRWQFAARMFSCH